VARRYSSTSGAAKCGRRGHYRLDKLIAQHGREARVADWLRYVARDCDRLKAARIADQCGVRCPELPRVL
jgi:hypothetical protein